MKIFFWKRRLMTDGRNEAKNQDILGLYSKLIEFQKYI